MRNPLRQNSQPRSELSSRQIEWHALQRWYCSTVGKECRAAEHRLLATVLPTLYGLTLITIGISAQANDELLRSSPIQQRYLLGAVQPLSANPGINAADSIANSALIETPRLPLQADSVDVIVLSHWLEFEARPRALLREVRRVLNPEGHVVISGFNPLAPWCLTRAVRGQWQRLSRADNLASRTAGGRLMPPALVRSWLFETEFTDLRMRSERFPAGSGGIGWAWWGSSYVVIGKKRDATLTPLRLRWKVKQPLGAAATSGLGAAQAAGKRQQVNVQPKKINVG